MVLLSTFRHIIFQDIFAQSLIYKCNIHSLWFLLTSSRKVIAEVKDPLIPTRMERATSHCANQRRIRPWSSTVGAENCRRDFILPTATLPPPGSFDTCCNWIKWKCKLHFHFLSCLADRGLNGCKCDKDMYIHMFDPSKHRRLLPLSDIIEWLREMNPKHCTFKRLI